MLLILWARAGVEGVVLVVHAGSLGLTTNAGEAPDMERCVLASEYASDEGVVLALENLPEPGSVELLGKALAAAPRLRVCVDLAHACVAQHDIAETLPGPYLELFARRARPGWTVFGNDVEVYESSIKRRGDSPRFLFEKLRWFDLPCLSN